MAGIGRRIWVVNWSYLVLLHRVQQLNIAYCPVRPNVNNFWVNRYELRPTLNNGCVVFMGDTIKCQLTDQSGHFSVVDGPDQRLN